MINRILTKSDLKLLHETCIDFGSVTFDIETAGLSFKDDIFSIGFKVGADLFWLPFETINDYRKKPKSVKVKQKKKQKQKLHDNQLSMFGKEVERIIPGLNDNIEIIEKPITVDLEEIKFLSFDECKEILIKIFSDDNIKMIAHNMKFDAKFIIYNGIEFNNWYFDTMLASWQIKEDRFNYGLKKLWTNEFGSESETFKELTKNTEYYDLPYEVQEEYNLSDCQKTDDLVNIYQDESFEDEAQTKFFKEQMMDVCEVLCYMEMKGINIDVDLIEEYLVRENANLETYKNNVIEMMEIPGININSNLQLIDYFYNKLGYKNPFGREKKAIDKHILEKWDCKVSKELLKYRKLRDTIKFVAPDKQASLMARLDKTTNRVHPTFNQHRTRMHRLSGSNPNTQNLPRKGGIVRESITADKNKKLLIVDYAQIELRCFAHYSQDPNLIKAFEKGNSTDIHEITRKGVIEPLFSDINKTEQRTLAKNVNFGVWYGVTAYGLVNMLNISKIKAQQILDKAFSVYYINKLWIGRLQNFCINNNWVGNCYGGKRRFFEVDFRNTDYKKKHYLLKEAVHFTVSSTAACILKYAMIKIHNKYKYNDEINMLIQVHDELIIDVPKEFNPMEITELMTKEDGIFTVPLEVDFKLTDRWSK